jgi:single-strand DNA-binding protein
MNKVILIGNLAKDVELATTQSGKSVAKFSLAVNRNFTNASGERECDFFNIVVWGQLAERCDQYLSKGKKAAISGSLQTHSYENKDGNTVYTTEVMADTVEFLSPKDSDSGTAKPSKKTSDLTPVDDDGLLF